MSESRYKIVLYQLNQFCCYCVCMYVCGGGCGGGGVCVLHLPTISAAFVGFVR